MKPMMQQWRMLDLRIFGLSVERHCLQLVNKKLSCCRETATIINVRLLYIVNRQINNIKRSNLNEYKIDAGRSVRVRSMD